MTENLKSCPFCGSEAEFNSDEFGEGVYYEWVMVDGYKMPCLSDFFDIEPFDGDWKDSLICREEC